MRFTTAHSPRKHAMIDVSKHLIAARAGVHRKERRGAQPGRPCEHLPRATRFALLLFLAGLRATCVCVRREAHSLAARRHAYVCACARGVRAWRRARESAYVRSGRHQERKNKFMMDKACRIVASLITPIQKKGMKA